MEIHNDGKIKKTSSKNQNQKKNSAGKTHQTYEKKIQWGEKEEERVFTRFLRERYPLIPLKKISNILLYKNKTSDGKKMVEFNPKDYFSFKKSFMEPSKSKIPTKKDRKKSSRSLSNAREDVRQFFELEATEKNDDNSEDDENYRHSTSSSASVVEEEERDSDEENEDEEDMEESDNDGMEEEMSQELELNKNSNRDGDFNKNLKVTSNNNKGIEAKEKYFGATCLGKKRKAFWLPNGDRFFGSEEQFNEQKRRCSDKEMISKSLIKSYSKPPITQMRYFLSDDIEVRCANYKGINQHSGGEYSSPQLVFMKNIGKSKSIDIGVPFEKLDDIQVILKDFKTANERFFNEAETK